MRNLIILLIFPVLVFSQSSNDGARLFSLLYIKGYPTKNRKNITNVDTPKTLEKTFKFENILNSFFFLV